MPREEPQVNLFYDDVAPQGSLRVVDQMVVDWLSTLRFRSQRPKVVTAYRSRYFTQVHEQDSELVPNTKQVQPYPKISVFMSGLAPDLTRRHSPTAFLANLGPRPRVWKPKQHTSVEPGANDPRVSAMHNRAYVTTDKDDVYLMPWPLAFDLTYQIDILTKTQGDMVSLRSALLARFDAVDETYLSASFPGYGKQMIRVTLERIDDTSDLETTEKDRTLRSTVTLTVHGWIFRVPVRKKTIKNVHVVIIDAGGEDPTGLSTLEDGSEFLDWYNDPDNYVFNADGTQLISVAESPDFSPPNRVLFWQSFNSDGSSTTGP